MKSLSQLIYKIRNSLWFIPSLYIFFALLAFNFLNIFQLESTALYEIYQKHWNGFLGESGYNLLGVANNIVTTIFALSMSLTMIVLALASAQLGPRIIDQFLGNKTTQVIIGLYLSAILFLMLLNARVGASMPQNEVPLVAVTLGYLLVIISPALMIYFVQHLASSIVPDNIVKPLSDSLSSAIKSYLKIKKNEISSNFVLSDKHKELIKSDMSGYLAGIKETKLLDFLAEKKYAVEFLYMPGDFIVEGTDIAIIYSPKTKISEDELNAIRCCLSFSNQIPSSGDVEYCLRKLVEIALRALSPGVNDPYTSHACLNYMFSSLQPVALSQDLPTGVFVDDKDVPRLRVPVFSIKHMYDLALIEVREASKTTIMTQMHILDLIIQTLVSPVNKDTHEALKAHAHSIIVNIEHEANDSIQLEKVKKYKEKLSFYMKNV